MYKMHSLERQSFSEVHQSAKKRIYKLWNTFKIIFLSVKLWRLWIPYHLQYIKSSKKGESGEIFVCMGQGQKSVLDACDLRSLGQFCNKYRYDSVLEITARDQKHFQKSQSLNTLYFTIHKYRLKLWCEEKAICEHCSAF